MPGKMLRRYWTTACQKCSLKSQCTTGPERRITRWEHEHLLEVRPPSRLKLKLRRENLGSGGTCCGFGRLKAVQERADSVGHVDLLGGTADGWNFDALRGEFLLTMWTRFVLNRRTISVE
jgi:hypothetical protein